MEEEIDIFELIEDDPSKIYVKEGDIIKVVDKDYSLEGDEELATFEEYKQSANKELANTLLHKMKNGRRINPPRPKMIKLDNFIDNVKKFYAQQPFFFDKNQIFWFWNIEKFQYEIVDDTDLMIKLDKILGLEGQTVSSKVKANYLEAFKRVGRMSVPKEAKKKWIQFHDKALSIYSRKIHDVQPNYFFTNPIPQVMGEDIDTPVMDRLFEEWVGVEYIDLLQEIIAYCCYRDYPIQVLFCLVGGGRNGKSQFLKVLERFIGVSNICSTELDLLTAKGGSRFESFKLYKKLVCIMGETNFGVLSNSSLIKKLTGGDLIGFEMKGKQPFDEHNYAKLIIASNSLPITEDTSEGFYRRWVIVDFKNEFPEGKDIVDTIPEQEYSKFCSKIPIILSKLLERGSFTNQGTIEERKQKYIMSSNPLMLFINEYCDVGEAYFMLYGELFTAYLKYLKDNKRRRVKNPEFKKCLEDEGFWVEKTSKRMGNEENWKNGYWVTGLELKG